MTQVSNIGRYRVMRRLGAGGMAEVLEAEALGEAGFVRRVAIKRMLGTATEDPSFARMFVDEARIASRLHHANIVSVLDYGLVDGIPFQVLELVDGVDARTLVRRSEGGKVPVDIALFVVAQIGHALAAAHEATDAAGEALGIVHRDVSPGNILISWDGDVKLADFGIAFAKDKTEKTEAGTTKGTLIFMSPEQAITGRVDRRADIFSLGCVLHTLLTGSSPLAGDHFTQFLYDQRMPLAPDLPEDVSSIIEIATQYDREQRFQSAVAMTEAVGRALAKRMDRESRRRLVEFLEPLRKKVPEPQGRLDALFRVDIVVAQSDPTVREFHTASFESTETALETRGNGFPVRPEPSAPFPAHLAPTASRRETAVAPSPARAWIAVAAAVVAMSVAGVGAAWWAVRSRARPRVVALPSVSSSASIAEAPTAMPTGSTEAPPAESATSEPLSPKKPGATASVTGPKRSGTPRSNSSSAVAPAVVAVGACTGTVYLSCPLAPRAAITIDGALTSYHHGDFAELGCSSHTIAFDAGEGRLANRAASPTSANARTSPLEVRCGLP